MKPRKLFKTLLESSKWTGVAGVGAALREALRELRHAQLPAPVGVQGEEDLGGVHPSQLCEGPRRFANSRHRFAIAWNTSSGDTLKKFYWDRRMCQRNRGFTDLLSACTTVGRASEKPRGPCAGRRRAPRVCGIRARRAAPRGRSAG